MPDSTPDSASAAQPGRGGLLSRRTRSGRPLWLAWVVALGMAALLLGVYQRQSNSEQPVSDPVDPAGLVMPQQGQNTYLAAVGRTKGLDQPCTAWLVAPGAGEAPADATAYAVTAGRCVGIADSATVISGQAVSGAKVDFNAFAALSSTNPTPLVSANVTEVAWASMRFTDMAVLALDRTYGDLAGSGVRPIEVAELPQTGDVLSAGVPVEGIAADQQYVRAALCQIGEPVSVVEGPWLFQPAVTTDCIGIRGGSAGSPLLTETGQAVGQVTTSTLGAASLSDDCPIGQPCAVTGGVTARADTSYGLPVSALAGCFAKGVFQVEGECGLEDPQTVVPAVAEQRSAQPGAEVPLELTKAATRASRAANKAGSLPDTACHARSGWSDPVALDKWKYTLQVPDSAGWVLACVGSARQPTPVIVRVDGTAPDAANVELDSKEVAGGLRVAPVPSPPEVATVWWTAGPKGTDCTTAEGYTKYAGTPQVIPSADLPAVVCLIAVDEAGNRSQPVGRQLG